MSDGYSGANADGFVGTPLCTTYVSMWFGVLPVQVENSRTVQRKRIFWGLADHREGGSEVIGTWLTDGDPPIDWRSVAIELANRGVIRVGRLDGPFAEQIEAEFRSIAQVGARTRRREVHAVEAKVSARLSLRELRAASTAGEFASALQRAVRRRRFFESDFLALNFVDRAMERVERRMRSHAACDRRSTPQIGRTQSDGSTVSVGL